MKSLILRIATLSLLHPLGACMSLSGLGGDSKYACKAPDGVACDSVSGTYANAIHHNLPSQRTQRAVAVQKEASAEISPQASVHAASSVASNDSSTVAMPSPLRSQARVLRLWIKPWEDADGDLYDQGYIYIQVDNGRWLIEHVQRQIRDAYAPLKAPPIHSTKPATEAAAGPNSSINAPATSIVQRPPFSEPDAGPVQ